MAKKARRPRPSKGVAKSAGHEFGDGFRTRLRTLIKARRQNFAGFANTCRIDPPRVSEWMAGEQLPRAEYLRRIAISTDVSLDWLLLGEGGNEPVFRSTVRTRPDLELDLAFEIRRHIHEREAEGAFDLEGGSHMRLGLDRWIVDGTGLLHDLRDREVEKVRAWIAWEARTTSLRGIADDIIEALRTIVPALPEGDTKVGTHVYDIGRAAVEAREFGSGLGVPEAPNCFRGIRVRDRSHPAVGPSQALKYIEAAVGQAEWHDPSPLSDRVRSGSRITPIKP
jgi:transcriptional regulator with XRE-family HTH domain